MNRTDSLGGLNSLGGTNSLDRRGGLNRSDSLDGRSSLNVRDRFDWRAVRRCGTKSFGGENRLPASVSCARKSAPDGSLVDDETKHVEVSTTYPQSLVAPAPFFSGELERDEPLVTVATQLWTRFLASPLGEATVFSGDDLVVVATPAAFSFSDCCFCLLFVVSKVSDRLRDVVGQKETK